MILRRPVRRGAHVAGAASALVLSTAALAGCGGAAAGDGPSDLVPIDYAVTGTSAMSWPLYVGEEKGFFADHGIDFTEIVTKQPSQAVAALIAGEAQFANSGVSDTVASIDQGASLKIVASKGAAAPYSIVAGKDVGQWSDLVGSTVIGDETHGISTYYLDKVAEANGVDESELQFTFAGSTADRYAALVGGAVDATIIGPPTLFSALDEGFTDLGPVDDVLGATPFNVVAVDDSWLEENREAAVGFMSAYLEANAWLDDPANRDEAEEILVARANAKPDEAKRTYDYFQGISMFPSDPEVTEDAMDTLLDDFVKHGTLTQEPSSADAYLDNSLIEEASGE